MHVVFSTTGCYYLVDFQDSEAVYLAWKTQLGLTCSVSVCVCVCSERAGGEAEEGVDGRRGRRWGTEIRQIGRQSDVSAKQSEK